MDIIKNYEENKAHIFGEGNATLVKEKDYIRVTDREQTYSSFAVHANTLLGPKQAYKSRYLLKLDEGSEPMKLRMYHKIYIDYLDVKEASYIYSDEITVTGDKWEEVTFSTTVPFGSTILDFIVYFIQSGGKRSDVLVKEVEIEEAQPKSIERTRAIRPVSEQNKRLVGTIRWDAFTESTPDGIKPCDQVARVLSYKEYHNQTPFFANVEGEKVSFPEYTMDIWEREADFAIKGGLDYFAYLWYETDDDMSQPRKMHLKSPNKDKILMCGILERVRKEKTMEELYSAMKDSCYLCLDNRPVVFLYGIDRWSAEEVEQVINGAREAGVKEELYIVGMSMETRPFPFMLNFAKGIDAVSWYSVGALETAMPYKKLADLSEETMLKAGELCRKNNIDIIPAFTAGRDTRARIRTGVSWCAGDPNATDDREKPYLNRYSLQPTPEELEAHIENTVRYVNGNRDVTRSYMICSYGWNEHEEGGWLCPTLSVDENNNVIRDENGEIIPDTTRLDILKKVIETI